MFQLRDQPGNAHSEANDNERHSESGQSRDGNQKKSVKTIIVKRMDLLFNGKECQLLKFTDISMYKRLKQKKEKINMMTALNTSVHHEMAGPLKANLEFSERLI